MSEIESTFETGDIGLTCNTRSYRTNGLSCGWRRPSGVRIGCHMDALARDCVTSDSVRKDWRYYIYIFVYKSISFTDRHLLGVMFIVTRNGIGKPSSNHNRSCLLYKELKPFGKAWIHMFSIRIQCKIGQARFFTLGNTTTLGEVKFWICYTVNRLPINFIKLV